MNLSKITNHLRLLGCILVGTFEVVCFPLLFELVCFPLCLGTGWSPEVPTLLELGSMAAEDVLSSKKHTSKKVSSLGPTEVFLLFDTSSLGPGVSHAGTGDAITLPHIPKKFFC